MFASGIQCHGKTNRDGSRCGWTKGGRDDEKPDVRNAENFLRSMAMKTPSDVTAEDQQYLAKLCLCRDHHQNQQQIDRVANDWAIVIEQASSAYSSATVVTASPVPVETSQFGTGWQSADWALSAQVGSSVVHDSVSRSTIGVQQQHPDAQEQHDTLRNKVRELKSVIQQKNDELQRAREENSRLQAALRLVEARLSPETALSDGRRNGKMSGSCFRRLQGWLKRFRKCF